MLAVVLGDEARAQDAAAWRIVESSGRVDVLATGAQPVALRASTELRGGEQIRTGADGRVVLRRGGDTLIVAPDSVVVVPPAEPGLLTRIIQVLGALVVRVESRKEGAFEVQTPFLVAVVKGTTFSVATQASGSAVHVIEGVVEVRDGQGAPPARLGAGQRLRVGDGGADPAPSMRATLAFVPSAEQLGRAIALGTGGLLVVDSAGATGDEVLSGGAAPDDVLSRPDPPPASLMQGLGGNRARNAGPTLPAAAAPPASSPPQGGGQQGQR